MAITTQKALEAAVKQARSVAGIIKSYGEYNHLISRDERRVLYELVGILAESKDTAINMIRDIREDRWEE